MSATHFLLKHKYDMFLCFIHCVFSVFECSIGNDFVCCSWEGEKVLKNLRDTYVRKKREEGDVKSGQAGGKQKKERMEINGRYVFSRPASFILDVHE